MKFFNPNPNQRWRKRNNLWVTGHCNYTDATLEGILRQGKIPENIRGQFAYVYTTRDWWVACVDHFSSISLYYTKDMICPNFYELSTRVSNTENENIIQQLEIMKDRTVGPETIYKEITRVEAEHYVVNGRASRYSDILCDHDVEPIDHEENYDRLSYIIKKMVPDNPTMAYSSGKDSAFVAMVMKSLGYDPRLIFITSENRRNQIDENCVKDYEALGWDIERFDVTGRRQYKDDEYKFDGQFWKNGQFSVKRRAMANYPGLKMSGEIGGGLPRSNVISNYLINKGTIDIDAVVNIWLLSLHTYRKRHYPKPVTMEMWGALQNTEGFRYIFEYYRDIFKRSPHPYMHTVYSFPVVDGAEHRIWAEGQDDLNEWYNIFGDYELQRSWINSPVQDREFNGIQKYQMYEICRKFCGEHWTDVSWNYPIVGMSIL